MIKYFSNTRITTPLFIFWSLLILTLSVIPSVESPLPSITFLDKIAHIGQYLVFSLLYYLMRRAYGSTEKRIIKELLVLSLILSVLNEVIQIPIPGRTFCLLDIAANFTGFMVVIICLKLKQGVTRISYEKKQ